MPRNPKRNGNDEPVHINWFPYYAGYSSGFVHDVLETIGIHNGDTILDPWNGSGTTTTTAYRMGANAIGCDINPVMVVAAKSALLDPGTAPSIVPLSEEIIHAASLLQYSLHNDPLCTWYAPSSASQLRLLHRAIWKVLVDPVASPTSLARDISGLSTLAAFFITALFRTTRHFLSPFVGSNPTWIRTPKSLSTRIRPSKDALLTHFRSEVQSMATTLTLACKSGLKEPRHATGPTIAVESSTSLSFKSQSVKAVVSSPPYLTRIDYAVATKPELAVLGMSLSDDFDVLRKSMIGAPTVRRRALATNTLGETCQTFLDSVEKHSSKGSHNYYHKLFVQYFSDMALSLTEIARLLVSGGTCVLVVQDSYYKELHADLARFVTEISQISGLTLYDRHDFEWNRNMVRVNSRARKYRESAVAVESALWFMKG